VKASVIVPVWNGREYLLECLDALLAQDYPDFEVIAVDNGSTDGSAYLIAERYPEVQVIRNEQNLGFAGGCNVGLRAAMGDVLVLLNQDTAVRTNWLYELVRTLQSDPDIGIVGAKALYPNGVVQHAGGYVNLRGEGKHLGRGQEDLGQFDEMRDVDYVTGASLGITREAYETIGELDDGFSPAYYEDVDWCYRGRANGFRVVYTPRAVLVHKEASVVIDEATHEGMYLFHRGRLRFVLKHWNRDRLLEEFVPAEQAWLGGLGQGRERLVAAIHHACVHNLLRLSDLMNWRQRLLDTSSDEADFLTEALLTLRTAIPLDVMRISNAPSDESSSSRTEMLQDLHQSWAVEEHEFHSDVPIVGPLIAAFRRHWNRISTQWYVRAMNQQQNEFNAKVVAMLALLSRDQRQPEEAVSEYMKETGREITELAKEIGRLSALLDGEEKG
jgi:GT2 family glycosyltransferase